MFKRRPKDERAGGRGRDKSSTNHWARVGMRLTFRAELMPGRDPFARTYEVARILASGRVELSGLSGQHTETEFEASH
jgi:hypothetical protein